MNSVERQEQILHYWFADPSNPPKENKQRWFEKNELTDQFIRSEFGDLLVKAKAGELESWSESAAGTLALVILLDQFTRNIYRDSAEAFSADSKALALSKKAIVNGFDKELLPYQKVFLYLPFMHSEDLSEQHESVRLFLELKEQVPENQQEGFDSNYQYAIKHREVIEKFTRFPHRNQVLGRVNTEEEKVYLSQPGAGF